MIRVGLQTACIEMESEVLHNGAIVNPTFAMGISGNSGGSLSYLEADKLLYSVGVMAAVLEHESNDVCS